MTAPLILCPGCFCYLIEASAGYCFWCATEGYIQPGGGAGAPRDIRTTPSATGTPGGLPSRALEGDD